MIDINHDLLPDQDLVYDWLTKQGVSWRVYHQGIPFFTMMLQMGCRNSIEQPFSLVR